MCSISVNVVSSLHVRVAGSFVHAHATSVAIKSIYTVMRRSRRDNRAVGADRYGRAEVSVPTNVECLVAIDVGNCVGPRTDATVPRPHAHVAHYLRVWREDGVGGASFVVVGTHRDSVAVVAHRHRVTAGVTHTLGFEEPARLHQPRAQTNVPCVHLR